ADRLDLPGDPRGSLALHVVAPERPEGLDEPARRIDLQVLTLPDRRWRERTDALVARAGRPVGFDAGAEVVLAPHLGVDDRLPEPLRRRLDVDLEHLLHRRVLQSALEPRQPCG